MTRLAGLLVLAFGLIFGGAAYAIDTGSAGWTIHPVIVYEGPGAEYDVVGDLAGDVKIRIDRCQRLWCKVRGEGMRGWVLLGMLSFGQTSKDWNEGPRLNYGRGGPGRVCFYEGANYTGAVLCRGSGFVMRDLSLYHTDDVYSSISIEGNVSVTVCRDRFFQSYCELVSTSTPRLHGFLDNNVSSVRVY